MRNTTFGRVLTAGALALALFGAKRANAGQVVVADVAYTHSATTTKDSHYYVKPTTETPANWQSPVDYAQGSVHVRLEVKTKPSTTPTRFQVCFEMQTNYCCTDQAPPYTAPGVYEWDTDVEKLWRPGPVDFTQGILRSALILKDTNNVKPAPENVGEATSALYLPSDVAVTVTLVSEGAVYQPPQPPDLPSGGASGGGAGGLAGASGAPSVGGSAGSTSELGGAGGVLIRPQPAGAAGTAEATPPGGSAAPTSGAGSLPSSENADSSCQLGSGKTSSVQPLLLAGLGAWLLIRRRKTASA